MMEKPSEDVIWIKIKCFSPHVSILFMDTLYLVLTFFCNKAQHYPLICNILRYWERLREKQPLTLSKAYQKEKNIPEVSSNLHPFLRQRERLEDNCSPCYSYPRQCGYLAERFPCACGCSCKFGDSSCNAFCDDFSFLCDSDAGV